jgi:hypothetical protein
LNRQGGDEFFPCRGKDRVHKGAGLGEFGSQVSGLIGCNRPGDPKQNPYIGQDGHIPPIIMPTSDNIERLQGNWKVKAGIGGILIISITIDQYAWDIPQNGYQAWPTSLK